MLELGIEVIRRLYDLVYLFPEGTELFFYLLVSCDRSAKKFRRLLIDILQLVHKGKSRLLNEFQFAPLRIVSFCDLLRGGSQLLFLHELLMSLLELREVPNELFLLPVKLHHRQFVRLGFLCELTLLDFELLAL